MKAICLLFATLLLSVSGWAQSSEEIMKEAVAASDRLEKDQERDGRSRPVEVMALAGIQRGWKVLDIFAGGGYYSELLARAVGEQGEVTLYNNVPYDKYAGKALKERFNGREFPNVEQVVAAPEALALEAGSLDMAMIIMSYHDFFFEDQGWPQIDESAFIRKVHDALKPGGVFVIVDHGADEGRGVEDAKKLHRIEAAFVKARLTKAGFEFVGESDVLRSEEDDHTLHVFDEAIRGKTDRFVHVYRKPKS